MHIKKIEMQNTKTPGVYTLLLQLKKKTTCELRKKIHAFQAGYYIYVGSARGGLPGRINRHLNGPHSGHWHIDALLKNAKIIDIQTRIENDDECGLAQTVAKWPNAIPLNGLGASDCKCATHLFNFKKRPAQSIHAHSALPRLEAMFCELRKIYRNHALDERDPFQTLIGCILSLRTQDPVTHAAMKRLFKPCPAPENILETAQDEIARLIYPVGMYRQKAKTIHKIAKIVKDDWHGVVSSEIDDLLTLPGVGRKTANLVRSFAFHLPAICVDTHVHRITNRWALLRTATPDETEMALRRILPPEYWVETNALLIQLGQNICRPTRPKCDSCPLREHCQYPLLLKEKNALKTIKNAPSHPALNLLGAR